MTKLFSQSETLTPDTVCDYLSGQQLGELVRLEEEARQNLKDGRAVTRFKAVLVAGGALRKAVGGMKKGEA